MRRSHPPGQSGDPLKLGLFGGTFNPIHRCHLTLADQVRRIVPLDRILFIPTGDPPHKPSTALAPAHDRFEMTRAAIAPYRDFAVSDIEVRRPGKSYSIETIQMVQEQEGAATEVSFIIGLDAFVELPTWRQADELLRRCRFVVIGRPGFTFASLAGLRWLPPMPAERLAHLDGNEGRMDLPMPAGKGLTLLHLAPCNVSASDIRRRLRRGETVANLLPASVESYIMRAGLYQEEADPTGG